jgi:hypothetical protein
MTNFELRMTNVELMTNSEVQSTWLKHILFFDILNLAFLRASTFELHHSNHA